MKELSPPSVNLKRLYEQETLPEEPILVVISPGADPSQELQDLANETIGHERYHQVLYLSLTFTALGRFGRQETDDIFLIFPLK